MDRKSFLKNTGLLAVGSLVMPSFLKAARMNGPFHTLRGDTGYFTARGGTIGWFVSDDVIVAIDSQFENSAETFVEGIGGFGGGPEKILFNTHHHGDHVGGNGVFRNEGYSIIAHEKVPVLQRRVAEAQGVPEPVMANITFEKEHKIDLGKESVKAVYFGNAHTGGDSVIWFEQANVAHMGDLVFNHVYPFIDMDGGAHIQGWVDLLETVERQANGDTIFIFGHSNPAYSVIGNRQDLLNQRDYLSHLLEYVSTGIAAGKNVEELSSIEKFEGFADFISFGDRLSLRANITAAYRELTS